MFGVEVEREFANREAQARPRSPARDYRKKYKATRKVTIEKKNTT